MRLQSVPRGCVPFRGGDDGGNRGGQFLERGAGRLLNGLEDRQVESPLTIDLERLIENVQGAAKEQVAYLVDMAKADALELLGETRQALVLVDHHV